jgi:hypothetical protein
MTVYLGDKEEYFTFITLEAYTAVKEWIDFRESFGEIINRLMCYEIYGKQQMSNMVQNGILQLCQSNFKAVQLSVL